MTVDTSPEALAELRGSLRYDNRDDAADVIAALEAERDAALALLREVKGALNPIGYDEHLRLTRLIDAALAEVSNG